jgi:hypothetical protein
MASGRAGRLGTIRTKKERKNDAEKKRKDGRRRTGRRAQRRTEIMSWRIRRRCTGGRKNAREEDGKGAKGKEEK